MVSLCFLLLSSVSLLFTVSSVSLFHFLCSLEELVAYVKLFYTTFPLIVLLWESMKLMDFDLLVLKKKMSVQEVSLMINQEHEIFYIISILIVFMNLNFGKVSHFIKGNVYNCTHSNKSLVNLSVGLFYSASFILNICAWSVPCL